MYHITCVCRYVRIYIYIYIYTERERYIIIITIIISYFISILLLKHGSVYFASYA